MRTRVGIEAIEGGAGFENPDEAVGYAKFHLSSARPGVAVHELTGV